MNTALLNPVPDKQIFEPKSKDVPQSESEANIEKTEKPAQTPDKCGAALCKEEPPALHVISDTLKPAITTSQYIPHTNVKSSTRVVPLVYIQAPANLKVPTSITTSGNSKTSPQIIVNNTQFQISTLGTKLKPNSNMSSVVLTQANTKAQPIILQKSSNSSNAQTLIPVSVATSTGTKQTFAYLGTIIKPPGGKTSDNQIVVPTTHLPAGLVPAPTNQKLVLTPVTMPKLTPRHPVTYSTASLTQQSKLSSLILPMTLGTQLKTANQNVINFKISNGQIQSDPKGSITVLCDNKPPPAPAAPPGPTISPEDRDRNDPKCSENTPITANAETSRLKPSPGTLGPPGVPSGTVGSHGAQSGPSGGHPANLAPQGNYGSQTGQITQLPQQFGPLPTHGINHGSQINQSGPGTVKINQAGINFPPGHAGQLPTGSKSRPEPPLSEKVYELSIAEVPTSTSSKPEQLSYTISIPEEDKFFRPAKTQQSQGEANKNTSESNRMNLDTGRSHVENSRIMENSRTHLENSRSQVGTARNVSESKSQPENRSHLGTARNQLENSKSHQGAPRTQLENTKPHHQGPMKAQQSAKSSPENTKNFQTTPRTQLSDKNSQELSKDDLGQVQSIAPKPEHQQFRKSLHEVSILKKCTLNPDKKMEKSQKEGKSAEGNQEQKGENVESEGKTEVKQEVRKVTTERRRKSQYTYLRDFDEVVVTSGNAWEKKTTEKLKQFQSAEITFTKLSTGSNEIESKENGLVKKSMEDFIEIELVKQDLPQFCTEDDQDIRTALKWRDGIGFLPGSKLKFHINEFGIIEMLVGSEFDKLKSIKKEEDPSAGDEILCCSECGCYGLPSEFISPNYCSKTCKLSGLKSESKRAYLQEAKAKRKKKKLAMMQKNNKDKTSEELEDLSGSGLNLGPNPAQSDDDNTSSETLQDKIPTNYPWQSGKKGFSWSKYLDHVKAKAAPVKLFKDPFPYAKNGFRPGMKLEGIDPQHPSYFCVMSVAEVQGYRIRLHFDGYPENYDFWVNADSMDIFPVGWCEKYNHILHPPPSYSTADFNWTSYLKQCRATAAPRHLFANRAGNSICPNGFRLGMKLEAVDKKNTSLVCVATVTDQMDNRFLVHFDSWDDIYDYWADPSSPYIHPVGWCDQYGHNLTPPNDYPDPENFTWDKYLKETKSTAAPVRAFKQRPSNGFRRDMRLECVDKRVPSLIRVCTVDDVRAHQVRIRFDGWPDKYSYWVDDDSPDIHPAGWCQKTGHPLESPLTPEDVYENFECPTVGCRGLGHLQGPKYVTHSTSKDCPYSDENLDEEIILPDRLSLTTEHDFTQQSVVPVSREPREKLKHSRLGRPPKIRRLTETSIKSEWPDEPDSSDSTRKRKLSNRSRPTSPNFRSTSPSYTTSSPQFGKTLPFSTNSSSSTSSHLNTPHLTSAHLTTSHLNNTQVPTSLSFSSVGFNNNSSFNSTPGAFSSNNGTGNFTSSSFNQTSRPFNNNSVVLPSGLKLSEDLTCRFKSLGPSEYPCPSQQVLAKHSKILQDIIGNNPQDPRSWTQEEVSEFVNSLPSCKEHAKLFVNHKIDGEAFLMLTQKDLVEILKFKLGPAIKLYNSIVLLRQNVNFYN